MDLQKELQQIAALSSLTVPKDEDYEYILTKEDENNILRIEINRLKDEYFRKRNTKLVNTADLRTKIEDIDWSSRIDKEALFLHRNKLLHFHRMDIKMREDALKRKKQKRDEIITRCDAKYFYNLMKKNSFENGGVFIENENTTPLIKAVCFFMAKDERFVSELGYSFEKGLLLRGSYGLGKTFLFKMIRDNERTPVSMYSMIEVINEVRNNGEFIPRMKRNGIIYLDDVGSEATEVNFYGTRKNWFREYFETFYLHSSNYARLVISTNLNFDEIEKYYTGRVRSRIKEVFNVVDVTGEDLRK